MKYAPIGLFVYNRLSTTRLVVESLQANPEAKNSILYIFSDGPKEGHEKHVAIIRSYIRNIKGFQTINIIESKDNKGLANSFIDGISNILEIYSYAMFLEDDNIVSFSPLTFYINKATHENCVNN